MFSPFTDNIFIQMALWASLLASFTSGVVGSLVVVKRISFIAGSISHSVLGGMGICLWLQKTQGLEWLDPMWGAFVAAIGSALFLGSVHINYRQREDGLISAIWSTGMAIGMIFITLTPGSNVELLNLLFGNILWIEGKDIIYLGILNVAVLGVVALYYRKFLALCFDEEQAALQGVRVRGLYLVLLCLVALSIVLLMQIIGTILVIALLTIPSMLASLFTRRLSSLMALSVVLCALFCTAGLGTASALNLPPAATIALFAAISYLSFLLLKKRFTLTKSRLVE